MPCVLPLDQRGSGRGAGPRAETRPQESPLWATKAVPREQGVERQPRIPKPKKLPSAQVRTPRVQITDTNSNSLKLKGKCIGFYSHAVGRAEGRSPLGERDLQSRSLLEVSPLILKLLCTSLHMVDPCSWAAFSLRLDPRGSGLKFCFVPERIVVERISGKCLMA